MDTGATDHMTYDDRYFVSYESLDIPKPVSYGNWQRGQGIGVGDIRLECVLPSGDTHFLLLKSVLFVPGLKRKLMSLSCITDRGNYGEFSNDSIVIRSPSSVLLLVADKRSGLYFARATETPSKVNVVSTKPSLALWHERFGHVNKVYIERMAKHRIVDRLDCDLRTDRVEGNGVDCEPCVLSKQCKKSFPLRSTPRAAAVGARVHVVICGPIATASIANSHYFVLYKDEFSGFRLIYFVNNRTNVFDTTQKATLRILNEGNSRVLKIVSDRGSEFTSARAEKFLLDNNILHEVSAPFSPSQNGFIERDNRTVTEACRAMLAGRKLPKKFWAEAANTAVYLLHRSISRNNTVTPYELFYGVKPKVGYLKVFGCVAYLKIPQKKRSGWQRKLESRAKKVVFVGYEQDFTYRLYQSGRISRSAFQRK